MQARASRLGAMASVVPIALIAFKIACAVDLPFMDHYYPGSTAEVALWSARHELELDDLLRQHFDHRIVFTRLTAAALARWGHWDVRAEMWVSFGLALAAWLLLRGVLRRQLPATAAWVALPIALVMFSLRQQINWLWGFQNQWFFSIFFFCAALACLVAYANRWWALPLAGVLVTCQLFAFGSGALGLPLVGAVAWLLGRRSPRDAVLWLGICGAALALFFHGYSALPRATVSPLTSIPYVFAYLGAPLISRESPELIPLSIGLGVASLSVFIFSLWLCVRNREAPGVLAPWLAIAGYAIGAGVLVSLSTRGTSLFIAITRRYITSSSLLLVASIALSAFALSRAMSLRSRVVLVNLWAVLGAFYLHANVVSFFDAPPTNEENQRCAMALARGPDSACLSRFSDREDEASVLLEELAAQRLTVYAHPPAGAQVTPRGAGVELSRWHVGFGVTVLQEHPLTLRVGDDPMLLYEEPLDLDPATFSSIDVRIAASPDLGESWLRLYYAFDPAQQFDEAHSVAVPLHAFSGHLRTYRVPTERLGIPQGAHLRRLRLDPVDEGSTEGESKVVVERVSLMPRD